MEEPSRGCAVTPSVEPEAYTRALSGAAAGRRVTVFVVAVEEPSRGCAVTQTQGAPAPAVTYNDGGRTMVRGEALTLTSYTMRSWRQACRGNPMESLQSRGVFPMVHWGPPAPWCACIMFLRRFEMVASSSQCCIRFWHGLL